MSFEKRLKSSTPIDLQLLLYVLGVAESLLYGLVIVTYVGALVAFNKAMAKASGDEATGEDVEVSRLLEVEAMVQIFGLLIFFIVSFVMVGGVKENDHNKLIPYLLLCITQITVIIIYSIFVYPSWFFTVFIALKLAMFMLTYTLYRRLVQDDEERRLYLDYDERNVLA